MIKVHRTRYLIDKLNYYTELYNQGKPEISDREWDDMYFELQKLEKESGLIYPDSPTQSIQYNSVSELNKVTHNHPMLSLDKTKDIEDLKNFFYNKDQQPWFGMLKMDGLTCSLMYENGELVSAETRGDGTEGEDILNNAKVISSIPSKIPYKERLIIDGEIICRKDIFEKEYSKDYKNPRNFAAGNIRQLNNANVGKLDFVAWNVVEGFNFHNAIMQLSELSLMGFYIVPMTTFPDTIEGAIEELDTIYNKTFPDYPIDGYVFKFANIDYGKSLGQTAHHRRDAMAYKFYDEEYETRLKYITYDVSRNGVLTPVAVFDPVEIDGSTVEKASLHNISVMEEVLGETPYCGEFIWVFKANQIIPQISRANKMDYGDIISHGGVTTGLGGDYGVLCPVCEGMTSIHISDSGVKTLMCDNPRCEGKLAQRIEHMFGIKGLNIKGISRKTIEKVIDWGWVDSIYDMFFLYEHDKEWINKPGFGQASVNKITSAIEDKVANCPLQGFISGLGIPLVGTTIAKEIVKHYPTWEEFRAAVSGDWTELEGFGPEMSNAINNFDYTEADKIAAFLDFEMPEIQSNDTKTATAAGLTFCITGKTEIWKNRTELKSHIESLGGRVVGSMSSKVNYLINNDSTSTSSKNKAAKDAGIPIITEEEFKQKFDN